jgi:dTDP-4-amino-4,6-dideoxygalactose transaminase
MSRRIYLSPPDMCGRELDFIKDVFATNWIAPYGPHIDSFEREFAEAVGIPHATALSSGTAALHLALRIVSGSDGRRAMNSARANEVLCSTFTFAASANAITYEGAVPVFVDCDSTSWNMDPGLLHEELDRCAAHGKLPRAVIVVDLYGQCADYDPIMAACAEYGVPVIEDAAEALGATYWGGAEARATVKAEKGVNPAVSTSSFVCVRSAGSFGAAAAFSFNGNKVITTSGGGMLVSHDRSVTDKARFLATQAKDPAPHYQHSEIGFNYRMSNVLAAIGRGQLTVLAKHVAAHRRNFEHYRRALSDLPGIGFMPEAPFGCCTRWLTCLTIDPKDFGATREDVRLALEADNIESRPLWKPMHLQPVFEACRVRGGAVSERLFANGLCLPSGSALTEEDLERICRVVRGVRRRPVLHYIPPWTSRMAARPSSTVVMKN